MLEVDSGLEEGLEEEVPQHDRYPATSVEARVLEGRAIDPICNSPINLL